MTHDRSHNNTQSISYWYFISRFFFIPDGRLDLKMMDVAVKRWQLHTSFHLYTAWLALPVQYTHHKKISNAEHIEHIEHVEAKACQEEKCPEQQQHVTFK